MEVVGGVMVLVWLLLDAKALGWCLLVVNVHPELPQVTTFGLESVDGTSDVPAAKLVVLFQ